MVSGTKPVIVIAATTRAVAAQARDLITIGCETDDPIFSIDDAIAASSLIGPLRTIERGKETQTVIPAVMAALVAAKTNQAARVVYDKDRDMQITGKRHACKAWYRVAFDDEGMIEATEFRFFSNGGAFADLSTAVMERTMMHADKMINPGVDYGQMIGDLSKERAG
jgi:xanthine dehydrogenase molybdopterin-binding subunit B